MPMKTHFAFDVQYLADSDRTQPQRDAVMGALESTLKALLAAQDSAATVAVSDSHKGPGNKLVELTTTLDDARIAGILKAFSAQHGVSVTAFE
ncbi:hypothetical protein [Polaromonas naphthalenivorans]|uniref:Uncharacterized protein n=1 Tax=Polaromonas naphthalenivorans (strain CJ2) TaxID=365044 RepID=A1VTI6_POLNA|nr:hypothetical protein [Polaromonas naphthalenivorans]ABM38964.1 hypothetical protein Pnap_3668 [Polaromonas naphthalenivorans CJ2]